MGKSRKEVLAANEAAIAKKQADREAEKQAVRDILLYQAEQDAKLAAREAEEAAVEAAKKERDEALKRRNDTKTLLYLRAKEAESKKKMQEERKARDEQEYFEHLQHSLKSANR